MEKEFDLSEKMTKNIVDSGLDVEAEDYYAKEKDIKEFIKIIEEDYKKEWDKATDENRLIDKNKLKEILIKRAGDKLITKS